MFTKTSDIPIVFLHGFLGSGQDWKAVISSLSRRICITYDLPGHGKTPWSEENIENYLAKELPHQPIDLVGYSLGGRLAMRFALSYPSRIHSLTLISTNYGLSTAQEKISRLHQDEIWAQKIQTLTWDEFLLQWYGQPIFTSIRQKPHLMNTILSMRQQQKPQELAKALLTWSLGRQECYREQLLAFSRPTQIIYGEQDEKLAALYNNWPNARCIKGAGHILHLEVPQEIRI